MGEIDGHSNMFCAYGSWEYQREKLIEVFLASGLSTKDREITHWLTLDLVILEEKIKKILVRKKQ